MVNSLIEFAKELLEKNAALKAELDNQKYINKYCVFDKDGSAIIDKNKVQEKGWKLIVNDLEFSVSL